MSEKELLNVADACDASVARGGGMAEAMVLDGTYFVECFDKDGNLRWADTIHNVVTTVGKNLTLDTLLAGSAYTVTGPYMGLISATSYTTGPAAGDTMSSHTGWTEAGATNNPTYSGTRKTAVFSSASGGIKQLSAALVFTITSTGPDVCKGAFIVTGSGASATIDNTSGTLLSAGLFSGGDKSVSNGDTLNVSWQLAA